MTDSEKLLGDYVQTGSDAAFRELVTCYVDLVYSTALRLVEGDTHRAEDVAQSVFVDLARMARTLSKDLKLGGWLHRHTCFLAAKTMRGERRRQSRERQAVEMNGLQDNSETNFSLVAAILDEAINELGEADRTAILLRFYEQRDFRSVGAAIGTNEDAARMRVTRALEKLQRWLIRRGVTTSAAALSIALSAHVVQAAPAGLAVSISTAAALAGTTLITTATITKTIAMTTLQKTLIGATLLGAVGTSIYEARQAATLREERAVLQRQQAPLVDQIEQLSREREDGAHKIAVLREDNARLNRNTDELLRLRGEVSVLRRQQDDLLKQLAVKITSPPVQQKEFDAAWVQQMLNSPPKDQGAAAGNLRGKLLRREMTNVSPSEVALQDALLQRQLNQSLEHSPAEFADFQAAFIQTALAIADGTRSQQMRDLIQKTYEQAVASGLDIPSKPTTDTEAWVQRRFQLDRQATAQLKQLLTPDEQALFDRAFLGVMGIDLGGTGVDKSNYPKGFLGPE